jgi:TonB family protein
MTATIARGTPRQSAILMADVGLQVGMRDNRLAALVDDCYPAAARRMEEEGRAIARIVVGADRRAASWTPILGSGFPRLDAALGCVIRRLQFVPGRRDGRAVAAEVQLPIVFRLR